MKPKIFIWQDKRTHKVQTKNYCISGGLIEKERIENSKKPERKKK
jgi:hypothetical protein